MLSAIAWIRRRRTRRNTLARLVLEMLSRFVKTKVALIVVAVSMMLDKGGKTGHEKPNGCFFAVTWKLLVCAHYLALVLKDISSNGLINCQKKSIEEWNRCNENKCRWFNCGYQSHLRLGNTQTEEILVKPFSEEGSGWNGNVRNNLLFPLEALMSN